MAAQGYDDNAFTAIGLGLPRGMFYHAVALAAAQGLVWIEHETNVYVLGALVAFAVLVSLPYRKWFHSVVDRLPRLSCFHGHRAVNVDEAIMTDKRHLPP